MELFSYLKVLYRHYNRKIIFLFLFFSSACIGLLITFGGFTAAVLILIATITLPAIYAIIVFPKFGIIILFFLSYIILFLKRAGVSFPLGTIMDGIEFLLLFSFLLEQKFGRQDKIFNNGIAIILLIWIGYNFLEIVNPEVVSRLAWLYTIRTIAIITFTYFIYFRFVDNVVFIRMLLKLWLLLSFFGCIYGLKQEYLGLSSFEIDWLSSDPRLSELYFINGHWRIFSIFSDPVTFSYNMVTSAILCFCLLSGPFSIIKKSILGILGAFFLVAMLYSGTRGAFVLVPASFAFYTILKFNKRVFLFSIVVVSLLTLLIVIPNSNPIIIRVQSAFQPSEDPSYNVRKINQKKIQPYILSHPMGGGLGATETWGKRFAPDSYLANFPPDSGYVRVAVEQGWIGLLLFCVFILIVLCSGITNYFKLRDSELKSYCLAMTVIVFALNIGNYPQEALVQYPTNIFFYFAIALINITLRLDQQKQTFDTSTTYI